MLGGGSGRRGGFVLGFLRVVEISKKNRKKKCTADAVARWRWLCPSSVHRVRVLVAKHGHGGG